MNPARLFLYAWILWALSWAIAAAWSGRTASRVEPTSGQVWRYRALLFVGAVLLWHRTGEALGATRLFHVGLDGAYALAAVAIAGFAFTWWARIHLGRLWSGSVTRKDDHRVVDTGPYAIVRHPIYTGLIAATIATALAISTAPALLSVAFVIAGLWLKASIEERFLADELGPDAYSSYRARVPMLIPALFGRHPS